MKRMTIAAILAVCAPTLAMADGQDAMKMDHPAMKADGMDMKAHPGMAMKPMKMKKQADDKAMKMQAPMSGMSGDMKSGDAMAKDGSAMKGDDH